RLTLGGGAVLPLGAGSSIGRAELDARVHGEPILGVPFAFDVDLSLARWFAANLGAREGGDARPLLWVREALMSYGAGGFYAGLGRMRYAASTLGTLDGTRLVAPIGEGASIGAFGG